MLRADKPSLQFGQAAFGKRRESPDQLFADEEAEDGIAKELKLLVMSIYRSGSLAVLKRAGLMSERPAQKCRVGEIMSHFGFERSEVILHLVDSR